MKKVKIILASLLVMFSVAFSSQSESMHEETKSFKVYGNCGMCKKRIESALKTNKNIKSADWNVETKVATVTFDPHTITADEVQKIVSDAGHDTEKIKAQDGVYSKLPGCCQYDRAK